MSVAIAVEPEVTSVTYACPIEGCEWKLHLPRVAEPNAFTIGLAALELLGHVIGRYGADGRTPHDAGEVVGLGLYELLEAAFPRAITELTGTRAR